MYFNVLLIDVVANIDYCVIPNVPSRFVATYDDNQRVAMTMLPPRVTFADVVAG